MPYAKPREIETWRSEWIKAGNGQPVLLRTSNTGASVAIDGGIGLDGLLELEEALLKSEREAEPRLRKRLAIDELLGVYEGSPLAQRELDLFDDIVWLVGQSGFLDRLD